MINFQKFNELQGGQNVQISQGIAKRHKDGSSAAQNGLFKQGGGGGGGPNLHFTFFIP